MSSGSCCGVRSMSERESLWTFRHPTTEDAAYQRKIWESRCPELLATCDRLADESERLRTALEEIAEYVDSPGRPVLALMAKEALRG
jgi:hypothetical protein